MNRIKIFFSNDYLFTATTNTKFELFYLYFSIFILLMVIGYKMYLKFKGSRAKFYKKFDRMWFWGYLTLGISGLFIWFSRTQNLPMFSTRFVSYTYLLLVIFFTLYIVYLFSTKAPQELNIYYEKKRKEKYFK